MLRTSALFVSAFLLLVCAGGCTKYYRVTDPTSGRVYYATRIDKGRGGDVSLTDDRTGSEVTIQNSEVAEIKKEEYESGRAMPPTTRP
jgi:hypothetical protein